MWINCVFLYSYIDHDDLTTLPLIYILYRSLVVRLSFCLTDPVFVSRRVSYASLPFYPLPLSTSPQNSLRLFNQFSVCIPVCSYTTVETQI